MTANGSFEIRYEVRDEIGRGGTAVVHRVFDRVLGRQVAMKVPHTPADAHGLTALRAEAQTIAGLEHPGIVPIYDVVDDDGTTRILMKLIEGRSLAEILGASNVPPVTGLALERLLQIFLKVCDAVSFAHSRGVIHRDLTPANVMVGDYGEVYVMDWGLALLQESEAATDSRPLVTPGSGTLAYMAPEQARGRRQEVNSATDVFALGGILYHLLTLRPPWQGATAMEVLAKARKGHVAAPVSPQVDVVLPAGLCRVAMKALASDPGDRYASVAALRRDVETFLRGGGWFDVATYPNGACILREGEPGFTAYIVVTGTCEIYRVVDGRKRRLRTVGPGEVFGEVAFFTDAPRTATVEATSDVSVLVVTRMALERELEQSSWMRAFVRAAVERFAELDRRESAGRSKPRN
jgi:serine/threonine-protein kinase